MSFLVKNISKDVLNNIVIPFLTIEDVIKLSTLNKEHFNSINIIKVELIKQYLKFVPRLNNNIFLKVKYFYDILLHNKLINMTQKQIIESLSLAIAICHVNNITYDKYNEIFIVKVIRNDFAKIYVHDKNCNLIIIINTHRNKLNGISYGFHLNGKICSEVNYVYNELSGKIVYYDTNQIVNYSGSYSHNTKNGFFTYYQINNLKNKVTCKYEKDKLVDKKIIDSNGFIIYKYRCYKNGELESNYDKNIITYKKISELMRWGYTKVTEIFYKNGKKYKSTADGPYYGKCYTNYNDNGEIVN